MEGCFLLMCKYSNSCAAIKINEGCSYHEVIEKISAKFKELSVGNFCLFFFIPGFSNCIVECDDDLGNMMPMVGCSGSHVVDVVVGDRRIVEVDDNSSRIDFNQRVLVSASWKGIIHSVGREFEGEVPTFRIALAKYTIECGFAVNYLKNDVTRVTAQCMTKPSTSCKWFVHGKVLMNSGVGKARSGLFGDSTTSFDQLRWYLETDVCMAFNFVVPLLFVNGTFLKGRYKGHLLAATSKDSNQGLFPLAFAIVDAENQDNWMWFLSQLLKVVGSGRRLTFVSDRQHGLLDALSVVFPNAHHAYCLNHLKRNLIDKLVGLRTNYKLTLMKILVKCAYAPTVASF
ncbi:hypothetical protein ACSBR1_007484 [Camellia fascicularis]